MRKTLLTLVALFTLLVPLLAACGGQPTTTPTATTAPTAAPTAVPTTGTTDSSKPRIALVTDLGKVNDGTFNEFAHLGALRAAQEFGLEYKYIETQAQADYEKNIQTFVDEGFDVIVTVGFLIADATKKFAAEHPDIIFIGVDQFYEPGTVTDNLVGLQFREDQAGFLAGALAGMMTQTGTVGVVAGVEIPPVKRFKNAFDNGARYVNPNINLLGVYLPTFIDPALGASTAQQMIGEGADVIFGAGGPTGSGAIKEAAARGVYVIGVDQDEYVTTFANGTAPGADRILSSAIKRVDVAVYDQIKAVVNGTFKGNGIALYEAANGGIGYADYHDTADDVPNEVKVRMEQILAALTNGTLTTGVDPVSGDVDPNTIPEPQPFRPADVKLPKIALVTDLGKVNDGTFNEFAHLGALRAAQEFGLEYKYIETQAQADYEKNIQTFVDEGFDVIVTVGFLIADATKKFAAEHPDIIFIGVDQFYEPGTVTDNLVGLQFREDQAGFLAGALAGMMTQTGTVGVVAGVEIPPVKRFKNAFDNGARYVNPNINLLGVYLPTFIDPALGASTAQQMIGEGADVIFGAGGPTGSGAIKEAAARGVYVIGVDQDEYVTTFANGTAPGADRILSSAIKRVDVAVYDQIKAVVNGTFKGNGIALYEAANGGIGYADYHDTADDVPDAVKSRMEEILVALTRGELTTGVDPVSGDVDPNTIPEPQPFQP
ncbi:BMP family lipoprotein [Chloroflexus sp.]|uniref:BMP family lipoprotein n=1 Tax=Chloroflexus sp. TaxID=1904827 RepID=UPI00404AD9B4